MFLPWVGPQFASDASGLASKRLLMLGESHHSQEHEPGSLAPAMTQDVLRIYKTEKRVPWMRTFDNAAAAVTGKQKKDLGRSGVNSFWDQVAFYNYVPVVAAPVSRVAPCADHFGKGAEPFERVLQDLRPGAIIVWGYRLWAKVMPTHSADYADNPWSPASPFATIGKARIPALRMVHPSTAFSPKAWTSLVDHLLKMPAPAWKSDHVVKW